MCIISIPVVIGNRFVLRVRASSDLLVLTKRSVRLLCDGDRECDAVSLALRKKTVMLYVASKLVDNFQIFGVD